MPPAPNGAPPKSQRDSETVLLVEDQDDVRQVVRDSLLELGYNVLDAANPAQALSTLAAHPAPIYLLLADNSRSL